MPSQCHGCLCCAIGSIQQQHMGIRMTCLNCCQQRQTCCGRAPRQVLPALCKIRRWQPHWYHASTHCYVTAFHVRSCLASTCHLSNAIQNLRASNTMSACLPMKSTSARTTTAAGRKPRWLLLVCRPVCYVCSTCWRHNGSRRSPGVRFCITASLLVAQQSANCS